MSNQQVCDSCSGNLVQLENGDLVCTQCGLVQNNISPSFHVGVPIIRRNTKRDDVLGVYVDEQERRILLKVRGKRNNGRH